jgi:hypothetical protein
MEVTADIIPQTNMVDPILTWGDSLGGIRHEEDPIVDSSTAKWEIRGDGGTLEKS